MLKSKALEIAGVLVIVQLGVVSLDLAIPLYYLDELATLVITLLMFGIVKVLKR